MRTFTAMSECRMEKISILRSSRSAYEEMSLMLKSFTEMEEVLTRANSATENLSTPQSLLLFSADKARITEAIEVVEA